MIPFRVPSILPWFFPSLTWRIPTDAPDLYLTFDDGPVEGPTEFVLDTLGSDNKASFFCIGDNIRKYPDVFRKIIARGHAVANHTFNHLNGWKTDPATYLENVLRCEQEIGKHAAQGDLLFRPPYGKISRKQIPLLKEYRIVMWDVLTQDYDSTLSPDLCLRKSIEATRNGSIIVFHDSYKAEKTLRSVLPRFVSHFREKGFSFKKLSR